MKPEYTIELATPMREQLTEVVSGLEHFVLFKGDEKYIRVNKEIWKNNSQKKKHSLSSILIRKAQKQLWLINVRKFNGIQDIAMSNGGFLRTRKPYITYIEYGPQVFGYRTLYTKFISKLLLNFFLLDKNLICILFRSHAGYKSFQNLPTLTAAAKTRVKKIAHVVYPPINETFSDLDRFREPKKIKLFFIKNRFYEGGWKELLNTFLKITKTYSTVLLTVVTNLNYLSEEDTLLMQDHSSISLHHVEFTREELFKKFFLTHHIAVMPTYRDSFNMTINESIAASLPVISTDFFSIPERVIDGYNGYLCEAPFKPYNLDTYVVESFPKNLKWQVEALRSSGWLKYIEDFLYEKTTLLIDNNSLLQTMASNAQSFYQKNLEWNMIRSQIDEKLLSQISEREENKWIH